MMRLHRRATRPVEVDAVPFLSVLLALIPFLLLVAAFVHVEDIGVLLAKPIAAQSAQTSDDTVALQVNIKSEEFVVAASGPGLSPAAQESLRRSLPRASGLPNHDDPADRTAVTYRDLTQYVADIKARYPGSHQAVVTPEPTIPYGEVVSALDAIRAQHVGDGVLAQTKTLFPDVVLAHLP